MLGDRAWKNKSVYSFLIGYYTLNDICSLEGTFEYTIIMQPQENPCRVLLGLQSNSTEGFFLKNLYCLDIA